MKNRVITLAVLAFVAAACVPINLTQPNQLHFRVDVFDDVTGEFVISPKVQNVGERRSSARPNANAVMELRDEHNILRARMEIVSLIAIEPGSILDPAVWRGRLDPGAYRVFWGAPGLGHTEAHFVVTEQDDRQQLGQVRATPYPDRDMPALPTYGDAQPLVDRAVAQLSRDLNAPMDQIKPMRVEPRDFPDASLGAPQPGEMVAQVITSGYVIELNYQDVSYVFHGSGGRVVPVPASEGNSALPGLAAAWTMVEVDGIGLRFQAPDGWLSPAAWVWVAPGDSGQLPNAIHAVELRFDPAFPCLGTLEDGADLRGSFEIEGHPSTGRIGGRYTVAKADARIAITMIPTRGWQPRPTKLSLRFLYTVASVFRTWPVTYEWTAYIQAREAGAYTMRSAWRRIT